MGAGRRDALRLSAAYLSRSLCPAGRGFLSAALPPNGIGAGPQRLVPDGFGQGLGLDREKARALFGRTGARVAPGAGDRRAFGEGIETREARRRADRSGRLLHRLVELVLLHD